ncbi:aromatic amino acid DMT transporter YddG [Methylophilus sp. QUAN]|uniref:aromatic amino acid DMT transporter YddG n=1 Tax=Methylophilus sp. QUAN TaxID=2781020 RepID=UPI00188E2F3A|nr:aromatic amino acid DMT transporter YddG [Methylophilus sp. QUAN]MBF4989600.1 aromatic amino acid DMT transporter YddG [Methylophilus sp. QUAN]
MQDSNPRFNHATLVGCCAVLMWSVTVGLFRSVAEIFGPIAGAAMIFSVAGLFANTIIGAPKLKTFPRLYLWVGGGLFVLYEVLLALSIGTATDRWQVLELGMINYLWPSLTILFAVIARQQRGHWLLLPAMALCLLGIAWVMKGEGAWSPATFLHNVQRNPIGYGMALLAAIIWAVYSVFTRRFGKGINGVPLFLVTTAAVLWLAYGLSDEVTLVFNLAGLLQVCVMGTLMATAYSCWNYSIQHGNLALLATMSYFTPVLSVLLACLWLGVAPGAGFMYGVGLVTLGSLLSGRASQ